MFLIMFSSDVFQTHKKAKMISIWIDWWMSNVGNLEYPKFFHLAFYWQVWWSYKLHCNLWPLIMILRIGCIWACFLEIGTPKKSHFESMYVLHCITCYASEFGCMKMKNWLRKNRKRSFKDDRSFLQCYCWLHKDLWVM